MRAAQNNKNSKKYMIEMDWLSNIHPYCAFLEMILMDPLYLLILGFSVFILFSFILFLIVGQPINDDIDGVSLNKNMANDNNPFRPFWV